MDTPRVLIVEDEARQRKIMRKWLEKEGYECVEAIDGVDALKRFEEYNGSVNLVVLDVMMPRMDGKALINEMRTKAISSAPVIMCTGVDLDELADLDVFAVFSKPVDRKRFIDQVERAFYFGRKQTTIMRKVKELNSLLSSAAFMA